MWGTHQVLDHGLYVVRFISTHVGNTADRWPPLPRCSVHPHACGEHSSTPLSNLRKSGSSPRMWGTPYQRAVRRRKGRFIPTHVGNTWSATAARWPAAVHPHACGEHAPPPVLRKSPTGSSPRMWGTLGTSVFSIMCRRFIPTHVGNTRTRITTANPRTVHPHACGEHISASVTTAAVSGSSPRMWGTHLPYRIVFKEEKTPRKIYRLILYSVVRSRGWNATNCSPSNNTGCRRLTPRVWNS